MSVRSPSVCSRSRRRPPSGSRSVALRRGGGALLGRARWAREAAPRAIALVALAFVAHGIDIGWRGTQHVHPAQSVREAIGFLAFIITGGYLLASARYRLTLGGVVVMPVSLVLLVARAADAGGQRAADLSVARPHPHLARDGRRRRVRARERALRDLPRRGARAEAEEVRRARVQGPAARRSRRSIALSHRLIWVGFPIFTVALVLGAIWVVAARREPRPPRVSARRRHVVRVRGAARRAHGLRLARPARGAADAGRLRGRARRARDLSRCAGWWVCSELFVVGISWRTAPVAVREKLAFREEELAQHAASDSPPQLPVAEALLISTCNRVEVYGVAQAGRATDRARCGASSPSSAAVKPSDVARRALRARGGPEAVRHVFRVASALDSLVVGEAQILGQLKDAYGVAGKAGTSGPVLGRVRSSARSVSPSACAPRRRSRAARPTSRRSPSSSRARVFGNLAGKSVLVVGAGKMSRARRAPPLRQRRAAHRRHQPLAREGRGARRRDRRHREAVGAARAAARRGRRRDQLDRRARADPDASSCSRRSRRRGAGAR